MVVWRLYVVWGRNLWIAILPISMVVGEFGEFRCRFDGVCVTVMLTLSRH